MNTMHDNTTTAAHVERVDLEHQATVAEAVALLGQFAEESGHPLDWTAASSLPELFRRRHAVLLLARLNGEAVGFALCQRAILSFRGTESLNLHDIFVTESARGHGVGRRLLESVKAHARSLGCAKVTLEVAADNHTARALYGACGFGLPEAGADETHFLSVELD